jgi:exosortase
LVVLLDHQVELYLEWEVVMPSGMVRLRDSLRRPPPEVLALGCMAAALLWVCWPTFADVVERWHTQSQYSHGFLVLPFAAYLLWSRRALLGPELRPSWWALPVLTLGLGLRFAGVYLYFDWLAAVALLPCLAAACLFAGGWRMLHWAWPAIGFLVFMIPLPHRFEIALSGPLQRLGTIISTFALQTLGMATYSEGNVIVLGEVRIGVVEACSGLNMLMTFFALSTAVALLIDRSPLERGLIFVSAIPIALAANISRIIVTAILHKTAGRELADLVFHDLAGYLMPLLAVVMLGVLLRVLTWVLVPSPGEELEGFGFGWANPGSAATAAAPAAPAAGGPAS